MAERKQRMSVGSIHPGWVIVAQLELIAAYNLAYEERE